MARVVGAGRQLVDQQSAFHQKELHRQHPDVIEGGDDVLGDPFGFTLQRRHLGRGASLVENAAAVPVLHQRQGADGAARTARQGQGKFTLQCQPFFQHAGHATACQRARQLIQIAHLPLPLAVVPLAGRLEDGREEFAGLCGDRLFRQ